MDKPADVWQEAVEAEDAQKETLRLVSASWDAVVASLGGLVQP